MKNIFTLVAVIAMVALPIGCDKAKPTSSTEGDDKAVSKDDHAGHNHAAPTADADAAHAALHAPKYNQIVVVFPGHKYAMEIIENTEEDGSVTASVTAFLTNAHFAPIAVDAQEVKLDFLVDGNASSYTLKREVQEPGKPATFTATDKELAVLCCEGWKGDAMATVEINGVPYSQKMVKLNVGAHDHADHDHADHDHAGHDH